MRIHIALNVSDLEASLGFYQKLFGQPASKVREDYANFRLDEPPIHLALSASDTPPVAGATHFGVELPDHDTLGAWRDRMELGGTAFDVEDAAQCCYARADKLWLTDPDGQRWEIWARTGEYGAMGETRPVPVKSKPKATEQTGSACCA